MIVFTRTYIVTYSVIISNPRQVEPSLTDTHIPKYKYSSLGPANRGS